jgi:hypothetical protein
MHPTKIQAEPQIKGISPTLNESQPELPVTRGSEKLAAPGIGFGAPARARMSAFLQRQVGNMRLGEAMQLTRTAPPILQRQVDTASTPVTGDAAHDENTPTAGNAARTESIERELSRYQQISINVRRYGPSLPGVDVLSVQEVTVRAAYYINTGREDYAPARRSLGFNTVVDELNRTGGHSVLLGRNAETGELEPLPRGRAVDLGKATPEDIRLFVEEALRLGVIRRFAIQLRVIRPGQTQDLVDLDRNVLQGVIQDWIYSTGVGVDCSGFVQLTTIQLRGETGSQLSNEIPASQLHAARFASYPEATPYDLRPGDAWVVANGDHIRMISAILRRDFDAQILEFRTAESSGGRDDPRPGQISRTWQVRLIRRRRSHRRSRRSPRFIFEFAPVAVLVEGMPVRRRPWRRGTFHHIS